MSRSTVVEKLFSVRVALGEEIRQHWHKRGGLDYAAYGTFEPAYDTFELLDYTLHRYIRRLQRLDG